MNSTQHLEATLVDQPGRHANVDQGSNGRLAHPSLVQLLIVFPARGAGALGSELGTLTPLLVLLLNAVWGLVASWWAASVRGS